MAMGLGADAANGSNYLDGVRMQADLVLFETRRAEWRSLLDPVNNLVYAADGRSVRSVVADGPLAVHEGRVLFADEAAVAEKV